MLVLFVVVRCGSLTNLVGSVTSLLDARSNVAD